MATIKDIERAITTQQGVLDNEHKGMVAIFQAGKTTAPAKFATLHTKIRNFPNGMPRSDVTEAKFKQYIAERHAALTQMTTDLKPHAALPKLAERFAKYRAAAIQLLGQGNAQGLWYQAWVAHSAKSGK